ncbi:MAG TPA: DAK2 domain-containing protein [Roseiflexaceae bacterium]|nr:DAK2 domain-containing protein [Roseiflexaceae bacterium]
MTTSRSQAHCWSGAELLDAFRASARWLEQHVALLNALNVFPVPDGDTGTNMSLTLNGAVHEVAPDASCAVVAERVGYWALMRGRGNSGIILSQVLRGWAQGLAGHGEMGAAEFAAALAHASAAATKAVLKPVEGTMLTVIREASEAAQAAVQPGATLEVALAAAVQRAHETVQRTPSLLPTLREAGVVDAGAQGLLFVLEGMLRFLRGDTLEAPHAAEPSPGGVAFEDVHGPDDFGYCTNFIISGSAMPFNDIRAALAAMGQSVVVGGDGQMIKAHLHLLRPGDALNYAVQWGALSNIEITNMDLQRAELHHTTEAGHDEPDAEVRPIGIVAVLQGAGFAAIAQSLGAGAVIDGGATMNPSTADLLAAIENLPQHEVIVLPNNRNIFMAAEQAAQLSEKKVAVVPSRTAPQGLAALLRFNAQADFDANVNTMTNALHDVVTAEITTAVRDATVDGVVVRADQTIGLLDGVLIVAADSVENVVDMLLDRMDLAEREIITMYYGSAVNRDQAAALARHIETRFADFGDVEVQAGGQSLYQYVLSAE